jgi:hypothetical protein
LHLTQVARLLHQVFMHLFRVLTGALLPIADRAFIQPKGEHDGAPRTAVRQQSQHQGNLIVIRPQAIEGRAFRGAERFVAHMTDVAAFVALMHSDVTCYEPN